MNKYPPEGRLTFICNAALISWDYGKEINVTLEDALFSAKSMAIMFGNGKTKSVETAETGAQGLPQNSTVIMKTEQFIANSEGTITIADGVPTSGGKGWKYQYEAPDGTLHVKYNPKFYDATGEVVAPTDITANETYFCTYDIQITDGSVIEISANSFPGTYYVTGDTFARSEKSGKDEFFQFIIPKAKVTSENTITLEAEGDPSVFNMNLRVLRPIDGQMMKLVKYNLKDEGTTVSEETTATLIHNHALKKN